MRLAASASLCFLCCLGLGCLGLQLEHATVSQTKSLMDMHYLQVLENIARTINNPAALPSFAIPISGSAQITDTVGIGTTALANAISSTTGLNPSGSATIQAVWNLTPVTEPTKLQLLRVAHQVAISHPVITDVDGLQKLHRFLGGEPHAVIPQGWWSRGTRRDVPRSAAYSAHAGNTYVWVMPEGVPGLSRFTLHMLDLASAASVGQGELAAAEVLPATPQPNIVQPTPVSSPAVIAPSVPQNANPIQPVIPPPVMPKATASDCAPAPLPAGPAEIMPAARPRQLTPQTTIPGGILVVPPKS